MDMAGAVGWFVIKKSVDSIYNGAYDGAYNTVFKSTTKLGSLEKKIDKVIEQNKQLQKEIIILKETNNDRKIMSDKDILDYDVVIVQDYVDVL
jgi:hypothetical protein